MGNIYVRNRAAGEMTEEESERAIQENEKFLERFRKDKVEMKSNALAVVARAIKNRIPVRLTIKDDVGEVEVTAYVTNILVLDRTSHDGVDHSIDEVTFKVAL